MQTNINIMIIHGINLAINGQSHDSVKQSHDSANGPFFVTIKEGKGIQDSATMIK